MIFDEKVPVGVASLTSEGGIGYISNVGTIAKVRGKGFGKAITLFCVQQSMQNSSVEHCLATEQGEYPDTFYKRIGFVPRFSAVNYVRDSMAS
jgi:ribosomal protein S18 acetylase RimI-like enzyme